MSRVVFHQFMTYFLRQGVPSNLKHTILARMIGQHTPGIHLSLPQLWLQEYMTTFSFTEMVGI